MDEQSIGFKNFEYLAPATVGEALSLLSQTGARLVAGGTDLLNQMRAGAISPQYLVDLAGLGLNYVREDGGVIKIGAMTTVADLLASGTVRRDFACLAEAAAELGAIQCRNVATIGGNLCSAVPSADLAPPLLALGAQVRIADQNGDRVLPLENFFTGPRQTVLGANEILVEIQIPPPSPPTGTSFMKLGRRRAMTLAIVNAAALVSLAEDGHTVATCRIALGAVAPTPLRASQAEAILQGQELSESLIDAAATLAVGNTAPISDLRATAAFRREISRVLVKRTLLEAWRKALTAEEHLQIGDLAGVGPHQPHTPGMRQANNDRPAPGGLITLDINGRPVQVKVKPQALLVDVLRDQLGLIGTKKGCGTGECGACTVLFEGRPVNACLMLAIQAHNKRITTIEGLGTPENLHPLQKAFVTHGAVQCGFCAPGMLLAAKALLDQNPNPTEREIRSAIAGNICRCTGYVKIVESVKAVARTLGPESEMR